MTNIINYTIIDDPIAKLIIDKFVRKCPKNISYLNRLATELDIIIKKNFFEYILQVVELLDLVKDIPHIIRGSAGSSLVCYCLGITNIDPVADSVSFARFLNEARDTMPDIDFDFPHKQRDKVFERINEYWPERVARISNHVIYQNKSAMREAIRQVMIEQEGKSKFIPKSKCDSKYYPKWKLEIDNKKKELIGTMRCYSLHCGGIVIYDNQIPDEIKLESKNKNQIKYNKDDVVKSGLFKIDILSNRGLSQLFDVNKQEIELYPHEDFNITKLFTRGNNIGLTFAESPAMRKILACVKPKTAMDIAFCLALVRPAAANGAKSKAILDFERGEFGNYLIFDDDAIQFIQASINCNEGQADKYRRAFSKNKTKIIQEFDGLLNEFKIGSNNKNKLFNSLNDLRRYSFCKSHAISYAKLVWALAYNKVYNKEQFWLATLNNCHSSYKKWVHFNEAKSAGIKLCLGKKPFTLRTGLDDSELICINEKYINKDLTEHYHSPSPTQYINWGYWTSQDFLPNMCLNILESDDPLEENQYLVEFRGLIATGRICHSSKYKYHKNEGLTFLTIGYENGKFIDISINKSVNYHPFDVIRGTGIMSSYDGNKIRFNYNTNKINVLTYKFEKYKIL
jgi:DNA polymerase III alpha subunit